MINTKKLSELKQAHWQQLHRVLTSPVFIISISVITITPNLLYADSHNSKSNVQTTISGTNNQVQIGNGNTQTIINNESSNNNPNPAYHIPPQGTVNRPDQNKGTRIRYTFTKKDKKYIDGYQGSYALVVGVSQYTHGWSTLSFVPKETQMLKAALQQNGFKVTYVLDPDDKALKAAFENFINKHGYKKENRLLFFFSGHGHTREDNTKGYLVPTNAPNPRNDELGFLQKAFSMADIISWSKKIEAKHALFLFDSCFSGTVFKSKSLPVTPPHISDYTTRPVRQYITAGDAGEQVPAKSVFTPAFIEALNGAADLNKDGYIIGTELGMYLHDKVLSYKQGQTPQYGKIRDPDLDKGDFVFTVSKNQP